MSRNWTGDVRDVALVQGFADVKPQRTGAANAWDGIVALIAADGAITGPGEDLNTGFVRFDIGAPPAGHVRRGLPEPPGLTGRVESRGRVRLS